jgi:hypothetical protein
LTIVGEFYGWRNEAVAPHEEGSEISGWRQEEWGPRNDRTRRSETSEQATTAGNKRFAIAAPAAAVRNFWLALSWAKLGELTMSATARPAINHLIRHDVILRFVVLVQPASVAAMQLFRPAHDRA